jgi:uncharacterized membrane protein
MTYQLLAIVVLLGNGVAAGVLFTHAVGVWPAMMALSPPRYVEAHKLIGRSYDPMMPIMVAVTILLSVAAGIQADDGVAAVLHWTGAALLVAVAAVSQFGNVPINRKVKVLTPDTIPANWSDPRPRWRDWNLVRTVCALVAFAGNTIAVVLN